MYRKNVPTKEERGLISEEKGLISEGRGLISEERGLIREGRGSLVRGGGSLVRRGELDRRLEGTEVGKLVLSCSLGTTRCVPQETFP